MKFLLRSGGQHFSRQDFLTRMGTGHVFHFEKSSEASEAWKKLWSITNEYSSSLVSQVLYLPDCIELIQQVHVYTNAERFKWSRDSLTFGHSTWVALYLEVQQGAVS